MHNNVHERLRVPPERLRPACDPQSFAFETTAEVPPLHGMIGQERAKRALEFGLRVQGSGYNLFIAGSPGTGKTTYAVRMAREAAQTRPVPSDWVYVHNFRDPDSPQAIELPPGHGRRLRADMEALVAELRATLPKALESEEFEAQRQQLLRQFEQASETMMSELGEFARQAGFQLRRSAQGFMLVPLKPDGHPFSPEELGTMAPEERERLEQQSRQVHQQIGETARRLRALDQEAGDRLREQEQAYALTVIEPLIKQLRERYSDGPGAAKLAAYWDAVQADMLQHLAEFRQDGNGAQGGDAAGAGQPSGPGGPARPAGRGRPSNFTRYAVNVLVDNGETEGAPVVLETLPVYYHLVGKQEYDGQVSAMGTDLTMIKPGALHRANGGYLILQAQDVLANPPAWDALKRALKTGQIHLEAIGDQFRTFPVRTMRPEPIPLQVKVLLIGTPRLFHLLQYTDEDFGKLFKIRAEFDVVMDRNPETMQEYAMFISSLCQREGLPPFDRTAVARIIDFASRLAGDQQKVTTRFNELVEVIYEAAAWAGDTAPVTAGHVEQALAEREFRHNLGEQKLQELIDRGDIRIETEGTAVGQINGLSVLGLGSHQFGRPSRLTARTWMGSKGVVHIERETDMSGRVHDKGVLILSGYLGARYAQQFPLVLSASLTFEQLYSDIDGDSASSAELFALLSSLADVPLRQDLAVTGSVDQFGRIQPIGGVNEKIEGFFRVCAARGLTGSQGVIIPVQNVVNLMLHPDVVEAVQAGQFHVYAIRTIDEGLALLTGMEPGEPDQAGNFPPETVHGRAQQRLAAYAAGMARFQRGEA